MLNGGIHKPMSVPTKVPAKLCGALAVEEFKGGAGPTRTHQSYPIAGNLHTSHDHNYFVCGHCGHVELFTWPAGRPPAAWDENN